MIIITTILQFILMIIFSIVLGLLFMGLGMKITARIQKRYGPPFYQPYINVMKLFGKNSITHGFIFDFGTIMAFGGAITTLFFVPIGSWNLYSTDGTILLVIYLMAIASLGMAMATVGSGNPLSAVGISRALTIMLGFEIPYIVILIGLIYKYGTSSIIGLVEAQQINGTWNLLVLPVGTIVAFSSLIAMLGKKPFDVALAPAEIGTGPVVEYGGKYMGMLTLQHAIGLVVKTGLFVDLFLGGADNIFFFVLKMFLVWVLVVLVNAVTPRYRVEQGVLYYWKWPLVFAIAQVLFIIF
jgi:NADH-quinone oxidoreductase subunit H